MVFRLYAPKVLLHVSCDGEYYLRFRMRQCLRACLIENITIGRLCSNIIWCEWLRVLSQSLRFLVLERDCMFWSMSNKTPAAAFLHIRVSHIEDNLKRVLEKKMIDKNTTLWYTLTSLFTLVSDLTRKHGLLSKNRICLMTSHGDITQSASPALRKQPS